MAAPAAGLRFEHITFRYRFRPLPAGPPARGVTGEVTSHPAAAAQGGVGPGFRLPDVAA